MRLLVLAIAVVGCTADDPEPFDASVCGNQSASIVKPRFREAVTPGAVELQVHWSPPRAAAEVSVNDEQLPRSMTYDPMDDYPPVDANGIASYQFMLPADTRFTVWITVTCYVSNDPTDLTRRTIRLATSEFATTP